MIDDEACDLPVYQLQPAELRQRRKALGMSLTEFARVIGIHRNTVACWERGDKAIGCPQMLHLATCWLELQANSAGVIAAARELQQIVNKPLRRGQ